MPEPLKSSKMIIPWIETIRLTLSDGTKQVFDRGLFHPGELKLPSLVEVWHHDARGDRRIADLQGLEQPELFDLRPDDLLAGIELCRGNPEAERQESRN